MSQNYAAGNEELDNIRRTVIAALFSDDSLFDRLVLKGGNALRLVYSVQSRASIDIDLSLSGDFDDLMDIHRRIERALFDRLDSAGYVPFDITLEPRPHNATGTWGGYLLGFKVIDRSSFLRLQGDLDAVRRQALVLGPNQKRKWSVDISKYEYCGAKVSCEMDSQAIYAYSPEMIVIEKLRAICQQMPEYRHRGPKTPRPRDFYDIYAVLTQLQLQIEAPENIDLARTIFSAKDVPLLLLRRIKEHHDFHALDWPSVQISTTGSDLGFEFYFDYVVNLVAKLETLWIEETPARGVSSPS